MTPAAAAPAWKIVVGGVPDDPGVPGVPVDFRGVTDGVVGAARIPGAVSGGTGAVSGRTGAVSGRSGATSEGYGVFGGPA